LFAKRIVVLLVALFAMSAWWLDSATASDCAPGPNTDLSNCDFSFADLANADLQGSNLSNADFASADLTNVKLAGANVSGSKFTGAALTNISSGGLNGTPASLPAGWKVVLGYLAGPTANLTNATLTGATLTGVNLSEANLDGVTSGRVIGIPTLANTWRVKAGYLVGPKANLAGADLTAQDLQGLNFVDANLAGAILERASLRSARFTRANLSNANLKSATITDTNFTDADLTNANLASVYSSAGTVLTGAILNGISSGGVTATQGELGLPSTWNVTKGYIIGPTANLTGANLKSARVSGIDLSGATLDRVASGGISLAPAAVPAGWIFLGGYFIGPTADLTNAYLHNRDLSGVNLDFVNFTGADLFNVSLAGKDLSRATLTGVKSGAIWGEPSSLPARWAFRDGFLVGPTANFTNVYADRPDFSNTDLVGSTFSRMNLTGANLSGADLSNSTWSQTNIQGANLTGATLTGVTSTTLSGSAIFSPEWTNIGGMFIGPGANLTGATLLDFDLSGVNLDGANLTGANIQRVKSGSIVGTPTALPSSWRLLNGYLIGPSADLRNADLTGLDLRWVAVESMQISGANFTNARVGNADFRTSDLSGVLFKNTDLVGMRCTFCNLDSMDFSGADLTSASLYKATFVGSNLTETNFTNATLDSASVKSAALTGGNFTGANLVNLVSGGCVGVPQSLPDGWRVTGGFVIGTGANLTSENLVDVDFSGMTLSGVTVEAALMSVANLANTKMTGSIGVVGSLPSGWKFSKGVLLGPEANLSGLNLAAVSLSGVNLSGANLQGVASSAVVGSPSALPAGWKMFKGQLIGPGANLTDAILTGMNLDGVSLGETTLVRVTSGAITGTPSALPEKWKLINGYLIGREANLKNANLANQDLSGVSLWFSDMTGANLTNVSSGGIDGIPGELPPSWTVVSGYLVGPGANLENADLSGAELVGIGLTGANLTGANLDGVLTRNLGCQGALLPTGWKCIRAFLVGPKARLTEASVGSGDLTYANLSGMSMVGSSFIGVDFSYANLTGLSMNTGGFGESNLTGANLSGGIFSGVRFLTVNLTSANVENADFSGAIFERITSSQVKGIPKVMPEGWVLVDGVFLKLQGTTMRVDLGVAVVGKDLVPQIIGFPDTTDITYQWLENGTPLASSNGQNLIPSPGQAGKTISVQLTLRRPGYLDKTITSSGVVVAPGKLSLVAPKMLGNALVGSTMSTEAIALDPDTQVTIQWLENSTPKAGSTSNKLVLSSTMVNKEVSVRFTFTKAGFETLTLTTPGVKVGLGVLTAVVPKISGTAKVAKTLTAVSAKWASTATIQYQWLLDGKAIKAATKSTYKLLPTQKGRKISVQVTQVAAGYKSAVKVSSALKVG
jgi:uncharacterized protein YjbI with pentapeptide repeats